jgi:hypothetical protein
MDRVNEITFNSNLISEFLAIDFVTSPLNRTRSRKSRIKKQQLMKNAEFGLT